MKGFLSESHATILGRRIRDQDNTTLGAHGINSAFIWINTLLNNHVNNKFNARAFKAGIKRVKDILNENGSFMSYQDMCRKYGNCIDFVSYYGILQSVPYKWKLILNNSTKYYIKTIKCKEPDISKIISNLTTREIRNSFNLKQCTIPASQLYYERLLQLPNDTNWKNIWYLPFKVTVEEKVRYFQFKLLHRILPCNCFLKMINIIDDDKCHLCQQKETLDHMFWNCQIVKAFWAYVEIWINDTLKTSIKLDNCDVFLGFTNHSRYIVINYILYCAKLYLFNNRASMIKPDITGFKQMVDSKIKDDKSYYVKLQKIDIFKSKWKGFI